MEAVQPGLPRERAAEGDGPQEGRQEVRHALIVLNEFRIIVVAMRASERANLGDRVDKLCAGHVGNHRLSYWRVGTRLIEQNRARLPEAEGGLVEITDRAQPLLLAVLGGLRQDVREQEIQHVEGIIERCRLQRAGEGEWRSDPSILGNPRNRRGSDRGGIAPEGFEPIGGHPGQGEVADARGLNRLQAQRVGATAAHGADRVCHGIAASPRRAVMVASRRLAHRITPASGPLGTTVPSVDPPGVCTKVRSQFSHPSSS